MKYGENINCVIKSRIFFFEVIIKVINDEVEKLKQNMAEPFPLY